jgi:hypothetical protein
MTVTVDVINRETLNLLRNMESLGLIHVRPSVPESAVNTATDKNRPARWLRGFCKNNPGGTVKDFLANCRADKERELALEKRQEEERIHDARLSS